MDIPRFRREDSAAAVAGGLREAGCAIIEERAEPSLVDRIDAELAPYFERVPMSTGAFMGHRTQRTCRLVAKSPASRELMLDERVLGTVDEVLRGGSYYPMIHQTEAGRVHPGQKVQSIHRDDTVYPLRHPCPPVLIGVIWALSGFTEANGATRAVPGSHQWDDVRRPTDDEITYAEMPRGSVFLFNASLYHSAGGNRTADEVRRSITLIYGLGWLRPSENPYLAVPPSLARTLPPRLQQLLGYRNHGYLGHYELQSPARLLEDEPVDEVLPAADLFDEYEDLELIKR